jgi:histidine ammonia-lyase
VVTDAHFVPDRSEAHGRRELVVLTGADLTVADVEAVARHGARAVLDVHARERMLEARVVIDTLVARGEVV